VSTTHRSMAAASLSLSAEAKLRQALPIRRGRQPRVREGSAKLALRPPRPVEPAELADGCWLRPVHHVPIRANREATPAHDSRGEKPARPNEFSLLQVEGLGIEVAWRLPVDEVPSRVVRSLGIRDQEPEVTRSTPGTRPPPLAHSHDLHRFSMPADLAPDQVGQLTGCRWPGRGARVRFRTGG
jgi:hypothetical protein